MNEQIVDAPTPVAAGTFAFYEDDKGGFILVAEYTSPDHETPQIMRKVFPARMVKMARRFMPGGE